MTNNEHNNDNQINHEEAFAQLNAQRKAFAKMPVTGERFTVPREGLDGVDTILYRPTIASQDPLPVFFNLHGGAWVGGDAVLMDSFCSLLADEIPAMVVNVNYKKLDVHPFPYQQIELCDAVMYFAEHEDEYNIDKARFAIGGHSAGANLSAGAAIRLNELGFKLGCQMLVYPFVDFTMRSGGDDSDEALQGLTQLITSLSPDSDFSHRWISPLQAKDEELAGTAPAIIIVCGKDELKPHGVEYAKRLIDVAVPVKFKEYPEALHGFLEVNRKEYEGDPRRSPEQLAMTQDCEKYLINEFRACFEEAV